MFRLPPPHVDRRRRRRGRGAWPPAGRSAADAKADAPVGESQAKKKVVFYAGGPSHRYWEHDHKSGCYLLAKRINQVPGFEATVYYKDWPEAEGVRRGERRRHVLRRG